jgi:hypothetical protein
MTRASLRNVGTSTLRALRDALEAGRISVPITREVLTAFGVRENLDELGVALGGHRTAACVAILDVTIAEREGAPPRPYLVWSGPDTSGSGARDTAVVLRELFEGARSSVILAGFSFEKGSTILAPLHRGMQEHGLDVRFFIHVDQPARGVDVREHLAKEWAAFVDEAWPFGDPYPQAYYDVRAERPGAYRREDGPSQPGYVSLHAKCVVVDAKRAFVSSANFTQRAQERNIECGVLLDDPPFAEHTASQWLRLIEAGLVRAFEPA